MQAVMKKTGDHLNMDDQSPGTIYRQHTKLSVPHVTVSVNGATRVRKLLSPSHSIGSATIEATFGYVSEIFGVIGSILLQECDEKLEGSESHGTNCGEREDGRKQGGRTNCDGVGLESTYGLISS